MKIAAISQRPFIKNVQFINPPRNKEVQKDANVMPYFDIPFAASFRPEIKTPTNKEIQESVLESQRAKNEVLNQAQYIFEICTKARALTEHVQDKIRASAGSGITRYTDISGDLTRQIILDDRAKPQLMQEYNAKKLLRTSEFYPDGSIKITDMDSGMTVFVDASGEVTSIEVVKGKKLFEVVKLSDDKMKYIKFKKDKNAQPCADIFVYRKDYNESRIAVEYYKNAYGHDYSMPEKCESITYLANDDLESKTPFYILAYYKNAAKSLSKNYYNAQNAVFYTFDGVLNNSRGVAGRIVSEDPISYNKCVKFSVDDKFPLSNNIESEFAMMNYRGEFSEMPL